MALGRVLRDARFDKTVRVDAPWINEGAVLLMVPMSPVRWRAFLRAHGGCIECFSMGFFLYRMRRAEQHTPCPSCGDKNDALDILATRVELLGQLIKGWEGVQLFEDGKPVESLSFDPAELELLAQDELAFPVTITKALALSRETEVGEGKASPMPPSVDSVSTLPGATG